MAGALLIGGVSTWWLQLFSLIFGLPQYILLHGRQDLVDWPVRGMGVGDLWISPS